MLNFASTVDNSGFLGSISDLNAAEPSEKCKFFFFFTF